MIRIALLAGAVGREIDDVVKDIQKAYPAKRIALKERRDPPLERDRRRIQVCYDAGTGLVYELQEG